MSLLFVLVLYALVLAVLSAIGGLFMGGVAYLLTRRAVSGRKRAVILSALFPVCAAACSSIWFAGYALISMAAFDKDPGLGDSWYTPLPNGYAITMIDVTDRGAITRIGEQSISSQSILADNVTKLQVLGSHIYGAQIDGYTSAPSDGSHDLYIYFAIDTAGGAKTEYASYQALQQRAVSDGVNLKLRDIFSVYCEYRLSWFDYMAGAVLVTIPTAGFLALALFIRRVRQTRQPV